MKYINVTTPDNITVEYRLAGAGSRVGAAVVDSLIQGTAFTLAVLVGFIFVFDFNSLTFRFEMTGAGYIIAILLLMYFIIFFAYFIVCEIIMKGQTIGKRIFGLRTIRDNGQPITFIQSIIRNIIRVFIDNTGVGVVTMLFSKTNKRPGDMLAGTIVISENPDRIDSSSLLSREIEMYSGSNGLSSSYSVTAAEYEILKSYFARKDSFSDKGQYARWQMIAYFAEKFSVAPQALNEETLYKIMSENARVYK
jgi:uncharacterized RDD family membrane protein YckC